MDNSTTTKNRIEYLDTLRVLACFMVVLTHSTMPESDLSIGMYLAIISFIGAPSSELFLSLSGAILLPVKVGFKDFYRRRFLKLLPPVIFWSIILTLGYYYLGKYDYNQTINSILRIPLYPAISVYWFIYVMIGLYLFAPIISKWLVCASKRQIEFFLFIWLINLTIPFLNLLSPYIFNSNGSHYWMLNYFGGFLGYWILGYYLRNYPIKINANDKRFIFLIFSLIIYLSTLFILYRIDHPDIFSYFDNLQIGSAILVTLMFTFVQQTNKQTNKQTNFIKTTIKTIAKYSFGIYLIHIFIIREFVWLFFENSSIHPIPETLIIAIISMGLSILILWIISKLPYSKYITGIS